MNKTSLCKNPHDVRADYIQCNETCAMCDILNRNGSKIFSSSYALKYHVTTEHNREDEIVSGITREEVLCIASAVAVALKWNMLIDLPTRKDL